MTADVQRELVAALAVPRPYWDPEELGEILGDLLPTVQRLIAAAEKRAAAAVLLEAGCAGHFTRDGQRWAATRAAELDPAVTPPAAVPEGKGPFSLGPVPCRQSLPGDCVMDCWTQCQRLARGERQPALAPQAYWNGLRTTAERGSAVVADNSAFPHHWTRTADLVGQRIHVVRVVLDGVNAGGGITYLDDRDGSGWAKVTDGRGTPRWPHRNLSIEPGSFIATAAPR